MTSLASGVQPGPDVGRVRRARAAAGMPRPTAGSEVLGHRSTPPITGSMDATATMTSATWPPSHIAAMACRLVKDGSRKCTRYGRVPPSLTDVHAELALGRLHRRVRLAGRDPEALGDQLEVVDQGLHGGAHDLLDVVEGVADAVRAERELRGPGDLLVVDHDRARLQPVQALLDDPQRLRASPPAGSGSGRRSRRCRRSGRRSRSSRSRSTGRTCAGRAAGRRSAGSARWRRAPCSRPGRGSRRPASGP